MKRAMLKCIFFIDGDVAMSWSTLDNVCLEWMPIILNTIIFADGQKFALLKKATLLEKAEKVEKAEKTEKSAHHHEFSNK